MTTWIDFYKQNFFSLLNPKSSGAKRGLVEGHCQRAQGFLLMFELMLAQKNRDFYIIETGTLRKPGNWKDGQSARLFTEFVAHQGGQVKSVDIDPQAVAAATGAINSARFQAHCSDSVQWLSLQPDLGQVDLFYLDSWDVKWENDSASAHHHLREFQTIEPFLKPGTVVAIDDNSRFADSQARTGKGRMIVEYLAAKNKHPIYDAYQIIYQF